MVCQVKHDNTSYTSNNFRVNNFPSLNVNLLCKTYITQFTNSIAKTTYITCYKFYILQQRHLPTHNSYGFFGIYITLKSIHNITWKDRNVEIYGKGFKIWANSSINVEICFFSETTIKMDSKLIKSFAELTSYYNDHF